MLRPPDRCLLNEYPYQVLSSPIAQNFHRVSSRQQVYANRESFSIFVRQIRTMGIQRRSVPILVAVVASFFAGAVSSAKPSENEKETFEQKLERIESMRRQFHERWKKAKGKEAKNVVRAEAREFVVDTIANDLVPAWLGTPWTMAVIKDGLKPNAQRPGQKGRGISCSWFVVRILENAGLRFVSNTAFAGTISIHFQRALTLRKKDLHRYWNTSPTQLKTRFLALGDGLYVIGLNCHIGLVHVRGERVRFLHSSYIEPWEVVIEDLTSSQAIAFSEDAGYVVTPLFLDNRLIDYWITGTRVPFTTISRLPIPISRRSRPRLPIVWNTDGRFRTSAA